MQPCDSAALTAVGKIHPAVVAVIAEAYQKQTEAYLKLVKQQASWGEYARTLEAINVETGKNLAVADAQIRGELATAQAYEIQQRQAAGAALMAWGQYQQQIQAQQNIANAINRPRMTQCRYVGAFLQCTTM